MWKFADNSQRVGCGMLELRNPSQSAFSGRTDRAERLEPAQYLESVVVVHVSFLSGEFDVGDGAEFEGVSPVVHVGLDVVDVGLDGLGRARKAFALSQEQ